MTLKMLLRNLKDVVKLLGAVDSVLLVHEDRERQEINEGLKGLKPEQLFPEVFRENSIRSVFNSVLADVSSAVTLVGLYGTVLTGQPLRFFGIDLYTTAMRHDSKATLKAFLDGHKNGTSGLEGVLRATGEEKVMDDEVFATYRAMGCQTFSMWEISIHRIVAGTCAEAEKLARDLGIDIDEVLARRTAKE